jgi:hypothetical protein
LLVAFIFIKPYVIHAKTAELNIIIAQCTVHVVVQFEGENSLFEPNSRGRAKLGRTPNFSTELQHAFRIKSTEPFKILLGKTKPTRRYALIIGTTEVQIDIEDIG